MEQTLGREARRAPRSRRKDRGERHFAVDRLLEDVFDGCSDFRSVAIDDPTLLTLLDRSACHDLEQRAAFRARVIKYVDTNRFGLADVGHEPQFVVDLRFSHRPSRQYVALELIDAS